jgi:beta-glucosidase
MPIHIPGFNGGDRTSLALPEAQLKLIDAVAATGKPLVIVLETGSAVALGPTTTQKAGAILQAWYGGERGGQAIGEVLSGTVNPSGRLPVTFYASVDQLPPFGDYAMAGRTYRYFAGNPEYPFGHGLSYTRFSYSGLKIGKARVPAGKPQIVTVNVRNTGKRAGDEVVQLYLSTPDRPGAPVRSLKGFERVHLAPGEMRTVRLPLSPRDLALADEDGRMRVSPAKYRLWVGGGQPASGAPGVAGNFNAVVTVTLPR